MLQAESGLTSRLDFLGRNVALECAGAGAIQHSR
jgi:hypothetical protein